MKISISNFDDNSPLSGSRVVIDGQEIPKLANVEFEHRAGKVPTVKVEMFALGEFELKLNDAQVQLHVSVVSPDYKLVESWKDGVVTYRCEREEGLNH